MIVQMDNARGCDSNSRIYWKKFKQMAAWWDVIYVFIGFGVCALFAHVLFNRV